MKERGLRDNFRVFLAGAVERMENCESSRRGMGKEKFGFGQTMLMVCICVDESVSRAKSVLKIGFHYLGIICM